MQRFGHILAVLALSGCSMLGASSSFKVHNEPIPGRSGSIRVGTDATVGYSLFYTPSEVQRRGSIATVLGRYAYRNGTHQLKEYEFDCAIRMWRIIAHAYGANPRDLRPESSSWLQMTGNTETPVKALFNNVCR